MRLPAMWTSAWQHRKLGLVLVRREIAARYRGSLLGLVWSFVTPLLMLMVYTFVFSVVFKARWVDTAGAASGSLNLIEKSQLAGESKAQFALILLAGMMVYNFFAECVNRAPGLITNNVNYVKRVVFPLDMLPWVALGSALFNLMIQLLVWLLAYAVLFGLPPASALLIPLVWLPLVFCTLGLSWLLASLGVFVRDTAQVVGVLTGSLMFLTPIFYPVSALPENFQAFLYANPLTPVVEMTRNALYFGRSINWAMWAMHLATSLVVAWAGHTWFEKTRKGFADVL
jgi:lipopolysaccharide transport system permease protein